MSFWRMSFLVQINNLLDLAFNRLYFSFKITLSQVLMSFLVQINIFQVWSKTNFFYFLFKIIITYEMLNLDDITTKNDNKDWPCRKLIIGP